MTSLEFDSQFSEENTYIRSNISKTCGLFSSSHKKSIRKETKILVRLSKAKGKTIYPNMRLECQGGVSRCAHMMESSRLMLQCMMTVTVSSSRMFLLFKTNNHK